MENELIVNFGKIIEEMKNKKIKLCFIKDRCCLFIEDSKRNLYQIELCRVGSYLDKLIRDGITVQFDYIGELQKNIAEWEKEIWNIPDVKRFITDVVKVGFY